MPRRRLRDRAGTESESHSDSDSSGDQEPQEEWLKERQRTGGFKVLRNDERNYNEWCGRNAQGEQIHVVGNGAMYPEGYQPSWNQVNSWRCPLHDCHEAFDLPHRLGNHFKMKHRKALLHDCRNGKFIKTGKKRVPTAKEYRNGRAAWAPIVIGRAVYPGGQPRPQQAQGQQVAAQQGAAQPVPAAQAAPAAPVPAAPAPAPVPAPAPAPAPQPVLARAPPIRADNGAPSSSALAAINVVPVLLPRAPAIVPPGQLPLRELPAAAANNRGNSSNQRNNGGANRRNNSNRTPDFTKPKNPSIWDYINSFTPSPLPLPLDACLLTLLSEPRVCALPKCWKHRLRTSTPFPSSPSPTPTPPASISPFYPPSNLSRSGLAVAGPSSNTNNANNNENNNLNSSGPLTLKDLGSLALYLSRKDSTTPCHSPHCPVGKLSRARFDEINKAFNEGSTTIHKDMAFPKCKGVREEDLTGESDGVRAMRERFGEFGGCVNAYWAEGEEVEVGEVVMEDA
ncbi:hypothetical protein B0H65DRAFT_566921 [Neurospora tetraspora]|uniref:C2H2-type domain-containing protein n=1 Tax=Neurospora tetraspora TaxID=94610 RepID=A0AAE0JIS3_9PEZI|nr:hypothetical protein B0H65DRAFT_566921 [Neurospora tetraspora]